MKIEEHRRRAEVYRAAAEGCLLFKGMCIEIAKVLSNDSGVLVQWDDPETLPFRRELAKEVGKLDLFYRSMNGDIGSGGWPSNPDRVLIRGEILTRAAEYHEACVAAGRTL